MSRAAFLAVALAVWTAQHIYVGWRLLGLPVGSGRAARPVLWAVLVAGWLAYPLGRIWWRTTHSGAARAVEWVGAVWMGTLLLLVAAFAAVDVLTLGGRVLAAAVPGLRGAAAGAALAAAAVALWQGARPPRVTAHEVELPGLPARLDGLRLVQLSDLHLGSLLGRRFLEGVVARAEALEPDLVAVTGDLLDSEADSVAGLLPLLRRLDAPLGVVAVPGNHEYYAGIERYRELARRLGWELLEDRCIRPVEGLAVAGVGDRRGARWSGVEGGDLEAALAGCGRAGGATVLLAHSPDRELVEAAAARGIGLVLSGHTHGGQLWPFHALVRLAYPDLAGRHRVGATTTLVVSRGTGRWGPPMRLGAPAEIVVVTVRAPGAGTLPP